MEGFFECDICLTLYTDPRVLPCGHTFCFKCITKLFQQSLPPSCPLDRSSLSTVQNYEKLPKNFVVVRWIEEQQQQRRQKQSEQQVLRCEDCDRKASLWCSSCNNGTLFCDDCSKAVHSRRSVQNHTILPSRYYNKSKCSKHKKDKEIYCDDCHLFLCGLCAVDDHKAHRTMSVYKYLERLKIDLLSLAQPILNDIQRLVLVQQQHEQEQEQQKTEIEQLESRLSQLRVQMNERSDKLKDLTERQDRARVSHMVLKKCIDEIQPRDVVVEGYEEQWKTKVDQVWQQVYGHFKWQKTSITSSSSHVPKQSKLIRLNPNGTEQRSHDSERGYEIVPEMDLVLQSVGSELNRGKVTVYDGSKTALSSCHLSSNNKTDLSSPVSLRATEKYFISFSAENGFIYYSQIDSNPQPGRMVDQLKVFGRYNIKEDNCWNLNIDLYVC